MENPDALNMAVDAYILLSETAQKKKRNKHASVYTEKYLVSRPRGDRRYKF